jgi:hypothetical protein
MAPPANEKQPANGGATVQTGALNRRSGPGWQSEWEAVLVEEFEYDYTGVGPRGAPTLINDGARIARYGAEHQDAFAGQWKEADGSQVVAFTTDVEQHAAALATRVFSPDRIRYVTFRFTYQHLLDLRDRIPSIVSQEALTTWGPDVKVNKVRVCVLPDYLDRVRQQLMMTNPEDVTVEAGERPRPM